MSTDTELGARDLPGGPQGAADKQQDNTGKRSAESALGLGPRKRMTDPLVHHGRHFGRTIQAFCRVQTLIKNGLSRSKLKASFIDSEILEHDIYEQLLGLSPGLEERLCNGSEQDIFHVAELIQKGSAGARADDTKGLKGVILDWITPRGQSLQPPLMRNIKTDRGFYHCRTGELLCPVGLDWNNTETKEGLRTGSLVISGDQWPVFLYKDFIYNCQDIWDGLFRSSLLVSVTVPSLAYVATQVRFALCSSPTFSRTDLMTDSERFYSSVVDVFMAREYVDKVRHLLAWWDAYVSLSSFSAV
ncbi:hypothetical protein BKA70DRAFT_1371904 [Coprinopsis sp. MPI-PUGE-AT-0042]|nr:hypothetical protein BKA70DRAFT_1371904 [Coprinopsis sp. MPI-PUGE-AT-0042]